MRYFSNLKRLAKKQYRTRYKFSSPRVLCRVACLGTDIIKICGLAQGSVNHQKSRTDYLLELSASTAVRAQPDVVYPWLRNKYIFNTIEQQVYDFFSYPTPDIVILDSYSELTDQLFVDRELGAKFLANFGDVNVTDRFSQRFQCRGLLPINDLLGSYLKFFGKIREVYGPIPVVFIHFPVVRDSRQKFRERGEAITKAILEATNTYSIISLSLRDEEVDNPPKGAALAEFPYHYGPHTYLRFAEKMRTALGMNGNG